MALILPSALQLYGIGVPPYSIRNASQTITPIDQAKNIVRALDGSLLDLSYAPFRKYKSTITCTDQQPPAISGVWPGKILTVHCISELGYDEYSGGPERPIVPDSMRTESGFWFYRPILTMKVMSFNTDTDEYGASVPWTMELEED